MKFSYAMLPDYPLEESLRAIGLADQLGFHAVYAADETWHKDLWLLFAAAAGQTEQVRFGPSVSTVVLREPTEVLWYPEFAQWCGTVLTADWHRRFRAAAVVYGHLHIPRTTHYDGVRFEEVSLGYPREWAQRDAAPDPLRRTAVMAPHSARQSFRPVLLPPLPTPAGPGLPSQSARNRCKHLAPALPGASAVPRAISGRACGCGRSPPPGRPGRTARACAG